MVTTQAKEFSGHVENVDCVMRLLDELVDLRCADDISPSAHNTIYLASVVLWTLVCQRMSSDSSMETAVKLLIESGPSLLPANKRVTEGLLSSRTGSYSRSRSRMRIAASTWFMETVANSLIKFSPSTFMNQRVFTLDGTTIGLAPEPNLRALFPPCSDEGAFPIALLVVAHELSSAAALEPQIGAMYGEHAVSETALIDIALSQIPNGSLIMADSNFGIFAVAHQISAAKKNFVLRLTAQRFNSMRKKAQLIDEGTNHKTWSFEWKASPKDRAGRPHITRESRLTVWLHEIIVHPSLTIYLVTDQNYHAETFAEIYNQRGTAEIDIRNFKVVLDTQNIRARSKDTLLKEIYASVVAYNLIIQFRRRAAAEIGLPPRRLSFKCVCTTFKIFLMSKVFATAQEWVDAYDRALSIAQKDKLPLRPGRHYDRVVYSRNTNPNNFKKRWPRRIKEEEPEPK